MFHSRTKALNLFHSQYWVMRRKKQTEKCSLYSKAWMQQCSDVSCITCVSWVTQTFPFHRKKMWQEEVDERGRLSFYTMWLSLHSLRQAQTMRSDKTNWQHKNSTWTIHSTFIASKVGRVKLQTSCKNCLFSFICKIQGFIHIQHISGVVSVPLS